MEEGRGGERGGGGVQEEVQVAIGEVGSQFLSCEENCIHLIYSPQTKKERNISTLPHLSMILLLNFY